MKVLKLNDWTEKEERQTSLPATIKNTPKNRDQWDQEWTMPTLKWSHLLGHCPFCSPCVNENSLGFQHISRLTTTNMYKYNSAYPEGFLLSSWGLSHLMCHNFRFSAGVLNLTNLKYHYLKRKIRKDVFRYEKNIFRIKYYASVLLMSRDKNQYEEWPKAFLD